MSFEPCTRVSGQAGRGLLLESVLRRKQYKATIGAEPTVGQGLFEPLAATREGSKISPERAEARDRVRYPKSCTKRHVFDWRPPGHGVGEAGSWARAAPVGGRLGEPSPGVHPERLDGGMLSGLEYAAV